MRKLFLIITVCLSASDFSQTDTMAYIKLIVEKPFLQKNGFIEYKTSRGITTDSNEYEYIKSWFVNKSNSSLIAKLRSERHSFMEDTISLLNIFEWKPLLLLFIDWVLLKMQIKLLF